MEASATDRNRLHIVFNNSRKSRVTRQMFFTQGETFGACRFLGLSAMLSRMDDRPPELPRGALLDEDMQMKTCRLLRLPEVIEITGLGRDTIYRYIRGGRFPRQRRISERASGWREDEIRAWVDSRPAVESSASKESPLQTWLRSPSLL
jgi:prophage regulatory protein